MKGINWKVRIKNEKFWIAFIPALFILMQTVAAVFGIHLDMGETVNRLLDVVNAVFTVLAIVGIVNDPTTAGLSDSARALTYTKPKGD